MEGFFPLKESVNLFQIIPVNFICAMFLYMVRLFAQYLCTLSLIKTSLYRNPLGFFKPCHKQELNSLGCNASPVMFFMINYFNYAEVQGTLYNLSLIHRAPKFIKIYLQ